MSNITPEHLKDMAFLAVEAYADTSGNELLADRLLQQNWTLIQPPLPVAATGNYVSTGEDTGYFENSGSGGTANGFVAIKDGVLAISFRGSDGGLLSDYLAAALGQGAHYNLLLPLIRAALSYAQQQGIDEILVTGHSLGGIMAERFAYFASTYADSAGIDFTIATFGSPGTNSLSPTTDPIAQKVLNIQHVGDPVPDINLFGLGDHEGVVTEVELLGVSDSSFTQHSSELYMETTATLTSSFLYYSFAESPAQYYVAIGDASSNDFGTEMLQQDTSLGLFAMGLGGSDLISGTAQRDLLDGGGGNDGLSGLAGADLLLGEAGDDTISGGANNDLLSGDVGSARDIYDAQVFRLYQAMLARQPDDAGKEFWAAQLFDETLNVVGIAAGFESSTEFQSTYGSLTDSDFVNLLYNNVLGRDADPGGEIFWLGELTNGASRAEVAAGFSESNEFVDLTEVTNPYYLSSGMPIGLTDDVFRLYRATLDRDPDMPGLIGWLDFLGTGQSKVVMADGFVSSTEFQTVYGALDDTQFVNLLYNNVLNRVADTDGLNFWLNEIASGATRAEVVLGFSDSPEFIGNTSEAVNTWMRATPSAANDVLFGGADDDRMFGGFGADSFVFDADLDGSDTVGDLERWDTLVFNGFGYTSEADVLAHMSQVGVDTVYSDQGNTVTFLYTTVADLDHADMFAFDDTSLLS